jgi:hypothetical protein
MSSFLVIGPFLSFASIESAASIATERARVCRKNFECKANSASTARIALHYTAANARNSSATQKETATPKRRR